MEHNNYMSPGEYRICELIMGMPGRFVRKWTGTGMFLFLTIDDFSYRLSVHTYLRNGYASQGIRVPRNQAITE